MRALGLCGVSLLAATAAVAQPTTGTTITPADCTAARLGSGIPVPMIGEPVRSVTLAAPAWVDAGNGTPAHCRVDGVMAPISSDATARPINFRVVLPAAWNGRAAQLGGGGMNGIIPNLTGAAAGGAPSVLERGLATYGSDSGHQMAFGRGRGAVPPGTNLSDDWALNEEAIANLGYAQMKKTHDAAMVLIERMYGERPRFNYYIGTSQGGREALTVAQRYPADYDGIAANVPIVGFSSLMLAPELIRIHEKPLANWVTPAKINAIRGEFMPAVRRARRPGRRDHQQLRGVPRASSTSTQGAKNRHPWTAKRCPNNVDPNPADTSGERLSDRRADLDAGVRLLPLQVRDAAGKRDEDVRNVAAQHGSVRQRPDPQGPFRRAGGRAGRRRRCTRTWACSA